MTAENPPEDSYVEVAHEALLQQWGELHEWLNEARIHETVKARVREGNKAYIGSGDDADLSLPRNILEQAKALADLQPPRLNNAESEFVELCWAKRQDMESANFRRAVKVICLLGGLLLVSVAAAFYAWQQSIATRKSQIESEQRLMALETTSAIAARDDNQFVRAAHHFAIAGDLHENPVIRSAFHHAANQNMILEFVSRVKHDAPLMGGEILDSSGRTISWSRSGGIIVHSGNSDKEFSFRHPGLVGVIVNSVANKAVSFGGDKIKYWDIRNGFEFAPEQDQTKVKGAAFVGSRMISWSNDLTTNEKIKIWDNDGGFFGNLEVFKPNESVSGVEIDLANQKFWVWSRDTKNLVEISVDPTSEKFYAPVNIGFSEKIRGVTKIPDSDDLLVNGKKHVKRLRIESKTFLDVVSENEDDILGAAADKELTFVWNSRKMYVANPNWQDSPVREIEEPRLYQLERSIVVNSEKGDRAMLIGWSSSFNKVFIANSNGTIYHEIAHNQNINGVVKVGKESLVTWDAGGTAKFSNIKLNKQVAEVVHEKGIVDVKSFGDLVMTISRDGYSKLWRMADPAPDNTKHVDLISGSSMQNSLMTWGMKLGEDGSSQIIEISERATHDLSSKSHVLSTNFADTGNVNEALQLGTSVVIRDTSGVSVFDKSSQNMQLISEDSSANLVVGNSIGVVWNSGYLKKFSQEGKILSSMDEAIFDVVISGDDEFVVTTKRGVSHESDLLVGKAPSNFEEIKLDPSGTFAVAKCKTESGSIEFYLWRIQWKNWRLLDIEPLKEYYFTVGTSCFFIFGESSATQTIIMQGTLENAEGPLEKIEVLRNVREIQHLESQNSLALIDSFGIGTSAIGIYDLGSKELIGEIKEENTVTKTVFSSTGLAFTSTEKSCSLWQVRPTNQLLVWDYGDVEAAHFTDRELLIVRGNGEIKSINLLVNHSDLESNVQTKTDAVLLNGGMLTNR